LEDFPVNAFSYRRAFRVSSVGGEAMNQSFVFCCTPIRLLLLIFAWSIGGGASAFANQWASSVGEAREVQFRTRDISQRTNQYFSFSPTVHAAMLLDNSAYQLVDVVKAGAAWHDVQRALHRTCALAEQLNGQVNEDCNVRNDRRIRDYLVDLAKRIDRLRKSLDKDFARTQPSFCPQGSHVHSSQRPNYGGFSPEFSHPFSGQPTQLGYPRSTYDFDNESPYPSGGIAPRTYPPQPWNIDPNVHSLGPERVMPGVEIGPIHYRSRSNTSPTTTQRAAAIAEIGIEVLRMLNN
jgi:hypothetical protein